jgi:hypothetical protein
MSISESPDLISIHSLPSLTCLCECAHRLRQFLFDVTLHVCDIASVAVPHNVAVVWGDRIAREFHSQAKTEEARGLPTAEFMRNLDVIVRSSKIALSSTSMPSLHVYICYGRAIIVKLWCGTTRLY